MTLRSNRLSRPQYAAPAAGGAPAELTKRSLLSPAARASSRSRRVTAAKRLGSKTPPAFPKTVGTEPSGNRGLVAPAINLSEARGVRTAGRVAAASGPLRPRLRPVLGPVRRCLTRWSRSRTHHRASRITDSALTSITPRGIDTSIRPARGTAPHGRSIMWSMTTYMLCSQFGSAIILRMLSASMIVEARRRAGLSQRELALAAGQARRPRSRAGSAATSCRPSSACATSSPPAGSS